MNSQNPMNMLSKILSYPQPEEYVMTETYHFKEPIHNLSLVDPTQVDLTFLRALNEDQIKRLRILNSGIHDSLTAKKPYRKCKDHGLGRYMAKSGGKIGNYGYQDFHREMRRLVMNGKYFDIDVQNCAPRTLLQVCKSLGLPCSILQEYVDSRESFWQALIDNFQVDKDSAKEFFTSACNGGGFSKWKTEHCPQVDKNLPKKCLLFMKEVHELGEQLCKRQELKPYMQAKGKTGRAQIRSAIALFLQDIESKILTVNIEFLQAHGIEPNCPQHDGIFVDRNETTESLITPEFLTRMESNIFEKLGLEMTLQIKGTSPEPGDFEWYQRMKTFVKKAEETVSVLPKELIYAHNGKQHKPFVDLSKTRFKDTLIYSNNYWYYFETHRWKVVSPSTVGKLLRDYCNSVIQPVYHKATASMATETLNMALKGKTSKEGKDHWVTDLLKSISMLNNQTHMNSIVGLAKSEYEDSEFLEKLDSNPYLLGVDNGVIDLKDLTFRDGRPDDYVSMSVGYDFVPKPISEEFLDFVQKIYPVEEERDLVQKYSGYSLLGKTNEKYMLFITDKRGGNNGKSKYMQMNLRTFGQYGKKSPAELLYMTDSIRDINQHSGGLLSYKNKRYGYIEELSSKRAIDAERLKDFSGGNTSIEGRACGVAETSSMNWTCTLTIGFNENCCPDIDTTNEALVNRIITVPHRSKFVLDPKEVDESTHTYLGDSNIDEMFEEWRVDCLIWLLEGLDKYHKERFNNIPESCQSFKKELMKGRDIVGKFLEEHVEYCEGAYVSKTELWKLFKEACKETQRDKKTKVQDDSFTCELKKKLNLGEFKERYSPRIDGKQRDFTNVFMNYRIKVKNDFLGDDNGL